MKVQRRNKDESFEPFNILITWYRLAVIKSYLGSYWNALIHIRTVCFCVRTSDLWRYIMYLLIGPVILDMDQIRNLTWSPRTAVHYYLVSLVPSVGPRVCCGPPVPRNKGIVHNANSQLLYLILTRFSRSQVARLGNCIVTWGSEKKYWHCIYTLS